MRNVIRGGKLKRLIRAATLLALTASLLQAGPAAACASSTAALTDFADVAQRNRPFYVAEEGAAVKFQIQRGGHDCDPQPGSVDYRGTAETALATSDFASHETTVFLQAQAQHESYTVNASIPTTLDGAQQETLESFIVNLKDPVNLQIARNDIRAYIVDDEGAERFMLEPGATYSQSESFTSVRIPVFRAGNSTEEGALDYTVTPEGETSGSDYTDLDGGNLTFGAGNAWEAIDLRIANDSLTESDETLTITLGDGAAAGETTSTTLTIVDNSASKNETTNPRSKFHHPRQGLAYRFGDYRIREMHTFASDNLSGVRFVQLALRQKLKSGRCKWWKSGDFVRGPCRREVWLKMKPPAYPDGPYYFRLPKLTPSMGTRVRNYKGFTRATDRAGNVEVLFQKGRNSNTFEVKSG